MPSITRKDIVSQISKRTGFSQSQVEEIFSESLEEIICQLAKGNRIELRNFGNFSLEVRSAKKGRNPRFPEKEILIPARAIVKFKPSQILREKVVRLLPLIRAQKKKND